MSRKLNGWRLAALLLALVVSLACGETATDDTAAQDAANEAEWAEIEEQKAALDAKRAELAAAREAAAEDQDAAEGDADPAAEVKRLEAEVAEDSEAFYNALVEFINEMGMVEGEELTEGQKTALRMKSSEDMLLAREYIDKGGNYPKAISIYQDSLLLDPDNSDLEAALAEARDRRYMSEERFAQAKEGMTQADVRSLLGQPNLSNVRNFDDDNVEAWFYPVDASGSAAAIWFRERNGAMKAYKLNFEEVVRDGPTEVGGEDEEDAGT